jgi:pyridoxamine 5'-phosphate oxidase
MTIAAYYNDLTLTLDHIWALLAAGAKDRRNAFHAPVLSTVTADGSPQSRILVLRAVHADSRQLRFNTDLRSPKVSEIGANPNVALLLYDAETKIQLRLSGHAHVKAEGADVDDIWRDSDRFARRCYMAETAPSSRTDRPTSGLPQSVEGRKPEEAELVPARKNFALLLFEISQIDWLYLATEGHRRAVFTFDEKAQSWQGDWAIP